MTYHRPVLLNESIAWLDIQPAGVYLDLTYGGGGHSQKILEKLGQNGKLIAFDRDEDVWPNVPEDDRLVLVPANYRHIGRFLDYLGLPAVDGVLADLGVSSHQFDAGERGFSYREDALLDMRMGRRSGRTAADVLNQYDQKGLSRILAVYGEIKRPGAVAGAIIRRRESQALKTTGDLISVLKPFAGKSEWKFYSQVFQAIRIEVNEELSSLEEMLRQSLEVLRPGGRLVVISYHSLEDRLVKWFMRTGNLEGELVKDDFGVVHSPWKQLVRKPVEPGREEVEHNSRARSARLRVAEKL